MASSVYSRRFQSHQGLQGTGPSTLVPAGHVYVVKQVTFYCSALLGQVHMFLQDDASGAALFAAAVNPGTPEWFGFYGAIVFEPGDAFHFQIDVTLSDSADAYAGGYDLTLP
jgi:hypothetical protein